MSTRSITFARRRARMERRRVLNGFGGTRPGVSFPVGQTLGQTASFRQTAPETWCQSRVCGVSRPLDPFLLKAFWYAARRFGTEYSHASS